MNIRKAFLHKAVPAACVLFAAGTIFAADRAVRAGTTELALVERPGHATTESYHETTVPESAPVGTLVTVTL